MTSRYHQYYSADIVDDMVIVTRVVKILLTIIRSYRYQVDITISKNQVLQILYLGYSV